MKKKKARKKFKVSKCKIGIIKKLTVEWLVYTFAMETKW